MAQIKIIDGASELRIEIEGRFAGPLVLEVRECWGSAVKGLTPRLFIIDITHLSGYDSAGYKLLQELYAQGTRIAARTARSLAYLNEITSPGIGPELVADHRETKPKRPEDVRPFPQKRAAGA